jgi:FkbM family methyltransferase
MSMMLSLALRAYRAGLKGPVAAAASLYLGRLKGRDQRFSIDRHGHWVNRQPDATIVSMAPHTATHREYRHWVLDNWAFEYEPRPGDTVIDVGAGVGEEAVVFSKLVGPTGRVIAIEAHPETFACLAETIEQSGLTNVVPLCVAVTDQDGVAFIGSVDNYLANSIVGGSGAKVPARSLDSLADELGLERIDLVKMNIEGAERLAVKGMERISNRVSHVAISCHDFVADRDGGDEFRTKAEVKKLLGTFGYRLTTRPDHPNAWVRDYLYGCRPEGAENGAADS